MPQHVEVEVRPGGFALVLLKREPVNLMDLTMWQQLMAALEELEADQVCLPSELFGAVLAGLPWCCLSGNALVSLTSQCSGNSSKLEPEQLHAHFLVLGWEEGQRMFRINNAVNCTSNERSFGLAEGARSDICIGPPAPGFHCRQ